MGAEDIFNYYIGGLTLISTVVSITLYSRTYLAGAQIKVLDELLQETRVIYDKSCADGLFPAGYRREAGAKLSQLEEVREQLKVITYQAKNVVEECIASVKGLTKHIMRTSDLVKGLRSHLITTSDKYKRLRAGRVTTERASDSTASTQTTADHEGAHDANCHPPVAPPVEMLPTDLNQGTSSQLQDTDARSITETLVNQPPLQSDLTRRWWNIFGLRAKPQTLPKDVESLPV